MRGTLRFKIQKSSLNNMGKNQHVVPRDGKWAVKGEGNSKASSIHNRQSEAINSARSTAKRQASELFIHGRNGQIRDRDSFGNDPCPPRDKKH